MSGTAVLFIISLALGAIMGIIIAVAGTRSVICRLGLGPSKVADTAFQLEFTAFPMPVGSSGKFVFTGGSQTWAVSGLNTSNGDYTIPSNGIYDFSLVIASVVDVNWPDFASFRVHLSGSDLGGLGHVVAGTIDGFFRGYITTGPLRLSVGQTVQLTYERSTDPSQTNITAVNGIYRGCLLRS